MVMMMLLLLLLEHAPSGMQAPLGNGVAGLSNHGGGMAFAEGKGSGASD